MPRKITLGACVACPLSGRLVKDDLCYSCYQDLRITIYLKHINNDFIPKSEYNKNLFDLYNTYIKRYRLSYSIKNQAIKLCEVLESERIPIIKNWYDIYSLSGLYKLYQAKSTAKGCAFIKIGKMLQELGVLAPREDEFERQIQNQLSCFSDQKNYELFINSLLKMNTSKPAIRHYLMCLKMYSNWLFVGRELSIELATRKDFESFLCTLKVKHLRDYFNYINRYYKWAVYKGIIGNNPIQGLRVSRIKGKISVLDEVVVNQLLKFIRDPNSDPEQALMITLVLIWGMRTCDLTHSSILIDGKRFEIKLRRRELTRGQAYYNREEIISFPKELKWITELQCRFLTGWLESYSKVKKTYPNTPLFFHGSGLSNNYLSTTTINKRFQKATFAATGVEIPASIVKQTCGHLHSQTGDASALSSLGWSDQFAFHYTWLPREIWTK
jgi:integrase